MREAEILAVGSDKPKAFADYWRENKIPFIGMPDVSKDVSKLYKQEINLFKLGRMPMNSIIDRDGRIRFVHYGINMSDIPDNGTLLKVIDELNSASE